MIETWFKYICVECILVSMIPLFGPVGPEIAVIVLVIVVLAVTNKLGDVAQTGGETLVNFKHGVKSGKEKFSKDMSKSTSDVTTHIESVEWIDESDAAVLVTETSIETVEDLRSASVEDITSSTELSESQVDALIETAEKKATETNV